jgi:hypothetical protein
MGWQRAAPSWPLLEASRGGGGDGPHASFGYVVGCHRRKRALARGRGRLQVQAAVGKSSCQVGDGKKVPAVGADRQRRRGDGVGSRHH